ncbi:neuroblastoma breakpoint family member 12-like isoform X2 [Cavia porcellus]|uniref:neuroblastoma breakpoint family member 12-like isoform X2 n=1 Tax=Cavia porcellus TaxID=10141 RepID=UPI002FDF45AB
MTILLQPPNCWNYRHVPPAPVIIVLVQKSTLSMVPMVVLLSPDLGAQVNVGPFRKDTCSGMGDPEAQVELCESGFVRPRAAHSSMTNEGQKHGIERKHDDDSVLRERLHTEEQNTAAKLPLTEQLRLSMLLIQKQKQDLLELAQKLNERKNVSLLLKERLEVLLRRDHPETSQGCCHHQGQPKGCRLAEQLGHNLNPDIPEKEEDVKEDSSVAHSSESTDSQRDEEQAEELQASQGEEHKTFPGDCEAGDTQEPPCATAAQVDEAEAPSPQALENENHLADEDSLEPKSTRLITENIACFKPIEIFPKWRSILYYMRKSLRELLTEDGATRYEAQSHQEKYSEWHRLARSLALQLSPEHLADGDEEEKTQLLVSSYQSMH